MDTTLLVSKHFLCRVLKIPIDPEKECGFVFSGFWNPSEKKKACLEVNGVTKGGAKGVITVLK